MSKIEINIISQFYLNKFKLSFFITFFLIIFQNEKIKQKYKEEKFDSMEESFEKAKDFINKSLNEITYHKQSYILSEKPKISSIIPVYNSQNLISRAIKSIQNQNLLDIEIIVVNDFSTDNSLAILRNLQKEDPRIKIINNRKNMGALYSRSIGALSAKGKYIFPLDNDDMLLDKDIFKVIRNIAEKGNIDIVQFKGIWALLGDIDILKRRIINIPFSDHKLNLVLFQPKLGLFPLLSPDKFGDHYKFNSVFIWAKCIKSNIYKQSINKMGKERYSRNALNYEDVFATYTIFNTARSYKFVGKYGILKIERNNSALYIPHTNIENNIVQIYLTDIAIDFTQRKRKNYLFLVYLILFVLNKPQIKETLCLNNSIRELFFSCLNRIINSKYISFSHKIKIKKKIEYLKFLNFTK